MSRLTGLHHVQVAMPAGREDDARAFYAGVLGLTEVPKPEHLQARGGCWFRSGDGAVEIHVGVEAEFRPARKAHPALLTDDLDALRTSLSEGGFETQDDEQLAGFDRFYGYDPFGNRLEFLGLAASRPHGR
jgi:catechol 2,3-dioxygenase-like lactoylglutathione lyase family enzyme